MKRCTLCGLEKSRSEYTPREGMRDGLRSECRQCLTERVRLARGSYAVGSVRILECCEPNCNVTWEWTVKNCGPPQRCEGCVSYRQRVRDRARWNPDYSRQATLRNHGLTVEAYDRMLASQGHCCAICRVSDPGRPSWDIDHDHLCCPGRYSCGKCIRGLLCTECNRRIVPILDAAPSSADALAASRSTDVLAAAARYVVRSRQLRLIKGVA